MPPNSSVPKEYPQKLAGKLPLVELFSRVGIDWSLRAVLVRFVLPTAYIEAVKPLVLLEVILRVYLFLRNVSTFPLAGVVGAVIETDKDSLTLTRKGTFSACEEPITLIEQNAQDKTKTSNNSFFEEARWSECAQFKHVLILALFCLCFILL